MRYWSITFILLVLVACTDTASDSADDTTQPIDDTALCTDIVDTAFATLETSCANTERNQACYVNENINAVLRDESFTFNSVGDIADIEMIERLTLADFNTSPSQWGFAMLQLQANLPDTLPGQNVTVLLFGETEFAPLSPENGLQAYYVTTGIGEFNPCNNVPDNGLLVQTPTADISVNFLLNGVEFELGSTAYIQAEPDNQMIINLIEGRAIISANDVSQMVIAGSRTTVPLNVEGFAIGAPTPSEPYALDDLRALPVSVLPEQIDIAPPTTPIRPVTLSTLDNPDAGIITDEISTSGEEDQYSLDLTAGQTIFFESLDEQNPNIVMQLTAPDGTTVVASRSASRFDERVPIEQTGTHILSFFGNSGRTTTGNYGLNIWDVPEITPQAIRLAPPDPNTTIGLVEGALLTPGEHHPYTFVANEGDFIFYDAIDTSNSSIFYNLFAPDGTPLFDGDRQRADFDQGAFELTQSGTYTLVINGADEKIGDYTFRLWQVPQPDPTAITIGTVNSREGLIIDEIATPGEFHIYTFDGQAGQFIYLVSLDERPNSSILWQIIAPDGTVAVNRASHVPISLTLEQNGTYTLIIRGVNDTVSPYQAQLRDTE